MSYIRVKNSKLSVFKDRNREGDYSIEVFPIFNVLLEESISEAMIWCKLEKINNFWWIEIISSPIKIGKIII
jgi:hypothetical protein